MVLIATLLIFTSFGVNAQEFETTGFSEKYEEWLALPEKEREGTKSSTYYIYVTDTDGERQKYDVDFELWQIFDSGQKVKLKVNVFGHAELNLEDLK